MAPKGRYSTPRAHPRFALEMNARVTTEMGRYRARTHDLSRGGVSIYLPFPLDVGATFSLDLILMFGENAQSEPLTLAAQVVWCTHKAEGYQVGASFLTMDAQTQQYLQMFLNFLSEGVSSDPLERQALDSGPAEGAKWYGD